MNKKAAQIIMASMAVIMLSGCAGVSYHTDHDDGFYQWGKGKTDWTHRY